jgi:hypothetical protein
LADIKSSGVCRNENHIDILSDFFLAGKTLPVERGANRGVTQPATRAAAEGEDLELVGVDEVVVGVSGAADSTISDGVPSPVATGT